MNITSISNLFIPLIVVCILFYGFYKKVPLYDSFTKGAKEGMDLAFSIFPCFIGMIFGVNILIQSGILDSFFSFFRPLFDFLKIPVEILPMALIRPISGNASFALMINMIQKFGVDSYLGILSSCLQGSTDTTIYVLTLYFGSIGIKNSKYALKAGLFADLMALLASAILVKVLLF